MGDSESFVDFEQLTPLTLPMIQSNCLEFRKISKLGFGSNDDSLSMGNSFFASFEHFWIWILLIFCDWLVHHVTGSRHRIPKGHDRSSGLNEIPVPMRRLDCRNLDNL